MPDLLPLTCMQVCSWLRTNSLPEDMDFGGFPKKYLQVPSPTKNFYTLLRKGNKSIGFGMLRGWDEGWEDVCLGLVVHQNYRKQGCGSFLMKCLIDEAKRRKVSRIRLHVSPRNLPAIKLYKKLGFKQEGTRDDGELIWYYYLEQKDG